MQSYQNVSNSQLSIFSLFPLLCCKRLCKVIKMLAIHNCYACILSKQRAANAFAKLSKCQQFTTLLEMTHRAMLLQTLLQSYQNVSNSQLSPTLQKIFKSCKRFCKVIKMLAIHNDNFKVHKWTLAANAFAKLSKCQQFTTSCITFSLSSTLQTLLQSYQNVSNSQLKNRRVQCK